MNLTTLTEFFSLITLNRFEAEEVLKKFNLPPIQIEKLLDEPELEAKIEELLKQKVKSEEKND